MATREQIQANRTNAARSTGPRETGTTRLNAMKHGLRSKEVVLPTEDPAEFEAFVAAWLADWKPATMARRELVEKAAAAAWRKRRCMRIEAARLSDRYRQVLAGWDDQRRYEVDNLVQSLVVDFRAALRKLRRTYQGVERLIALWGELDAVLAGGTDGWADLYDHHERLLHLLGRDPFYDDDHSACPASWQLLIRNAPEHDRGGDLEPFEDEAAAQGVADLRRLIAGQVEALRATLATLPDPAEERARDAELAAFEPTPEDAALQRYEAQLDREIHRALADLVKLTQTGADLAAAELPNEAIPPEDASEDEVKSDAPAPVSPRRARRRPAQATPPPSPASPTASADPDRPPRARRRTRNGR